MRETKFFVPSDTALKFFANSVKLVERLQSTLSNSSYLGFPALDFLSLELLNILKSSLIARSLVRCMDKQKK